MGIINKHVSWVPAFNEADNIDKVLAAFHHWPRSRIVAMDNNGGA
jgi:hypothetical protein